MQNYSGNKRVLLGIVRYKGFCLDLPQQHPSFVIKLHSPKTWQIWLNLSQSRPRSKYTEDNKVVWTTGRYRWCKPAKGDRDPILPSCRRSIGHWQNIYAIPHWNCIVDWFAWQAVLWHCSEQEYKFKARQWRQVINSSWKWVMWPTAKMGKEGIFPKILLQCVSCGKVLVYCNSCRAIDFAIVVGPKEAGHPNKKSANLI